MDDKRNADQTRNHVGDGLRDLNTGQSPKVYGDEQSGDEGGTRTQNREEGGNAGAADALVEHIDGNRKRQEEDTDGGVTKRGNARGDHVFAFLEDVNDLVGEEITESGEAEHDAKTKHRRKD